MTENIKNKDKQPKVLQLQPSGVCCQRMFVAVDDDIVVDAEFIGGCPGNLQAVKELIKGMKIDDVIAKLQGITCGSKSTSCPAQLAQGLLAYKKEQLSVK